MDDDPDLDRLDTILSDQKFELDSIASTTTTDSQSVASQAEDGIVVAATTHVQPLATYRRQLRTTRANSRPRIPPQTDTDDRNNEEDEDQDDDDDEDWGDVEEARRYLEEEQRATFQDLLERWGGRDDDGDVVDLRTGRIITSAGHLNALPAPRGHFDSETSESSDTSTEYLAEPQADIPSTWHVDPFREITFKPTPVLDAIVAELVAL